MYVRISCLETRQGYGTHVSRCETFMAAMRAVRVIVHGTADEETMEESERWRA
jgi:hypothetical protein